MHGQGRRLHRPLQRFLVPTAGGVDDSEDGWMDTSEEKDVWDEDAYYAHLDNLDFD